MTEDATHTHTQEQRGTWATTEDVYIHTNTHTQTHTHKHTHTHLGNDRGRNTAVLIGFQCHLFFINLFYTIFFYTHLGNDRGRNTAVLIGLQSHFIHHRRHTQLCRLRHLHIYGTCKDTYMGCIRTYMWDI